MREQAFSNDDIQMLRDIGVSEAHLATLLRAAGVNCPVDSTTARVATSNLLSTAEVQVLKAGGARGLNHEEHTELNNAAIRSLNILTRECRELVETALDFSSVARLLKIPETEVKREALSTPPLLHAVHLKDGQLRFPQWQFTSSGELPHLSSVLAIIGQSVTPLALSRFMLLPNCDLESQSGLLCPRDWLLHTANPEPVLDLARFMTSD